MNKQQARVYAAAFIDGEGTIRLQKQRKYKRASFTYLPLAAAFNTVREPLELLKTHWGGCIRTGSVATSSRRQGYTWEIKRDAAKEFLRQIEPFLLIKAEQARLVLSCPLGKSGHRLTPFQRYERERIHRQITILNRKGPRAEQLRMELKEQEQLKLL